MIAWGASSPFPGVYERTSAGGFTLGTLAGGPDDRVGGLQRVLEGVGAVELTGNLAGVRWSKLALNCAISSLGTIGGDRLGSLLVQRFVRRLALEVMTEVVAVAQAEGIRLEKVAGTLDLEWVALTESERAADLGSPRSSRSTPCSSRSAPGTGGCAPRCWRRSSGARSRRWTSSTARWWSARRATG